MKGDITIDKMTGLVYRDGKVLGRKNFIVKLMFLFIKQLSE